MTIEQPAPAAPAAPAPAAPAADPAPASAAPAPAAPASAPEITWTTNLSPDLQNYVSTKGFKSPETVLDSYRNLEKLHGVPSERLLKLPEKSDDPSWGDIYSKLGRPEKAADYGFKAPEGGNEALADWAKNAMHEAGLSHSQAEKIFNGFSEFETNQNAQSGQDYATNIEAQETALKKEWGIAYDKNVNLAQKAANSFGIEAEMMDSMEKAMGFDGLMKHLQNIGSKMGEDSFVGGDAPAGFGAMTPPQAQSRLRALRADSSFSKRLMNKDIEATTEWDNLHKMAYPSA